VLTICEFGLLTAPSYVCVDFLTLPRHQKDLQTTAPSVSFGMSLLRSSRQSSMVAVVHALAESSEQADRALEYFHSLPQATITSDHYDAAFQYAMHHHIALSLHAAIESIVGTEHLDDFDPFSSALPASVDSARVRAGVIQHVLDAHDQGLRAAADEFAQKMVLDLKSGVPLAIFQTPRYASMMSGRMSARVGSSRTAVAPTLSAEVDAELDFSRPEWASHIATPQQFIDILKAIRRRCAQASLDMSKSHKMAMTYLQRYQLAYHASLALSYSSSLDEALAFVLGRVDVDPGALRASDFEGVSSTRFAMGVSMVVAADDSDMLDTADEYAQSQVRFVGTCLCETFLCFTFRVVPSRSHSVV
jgi:hypothetical protein